MVLSSLGALIPSLPKFNPPSSSTTRRCRLRLSPTYSMNSITAAAATSAVDPTLVKGSRGFLAHFLIHSLGFSEAEAISASTKVRPPKSFNNPQIILQLLRTYGFDEALLKEIVSTSPHILSMRAKTIQPKLDFFLQYLGFSRQDFVKIIMKKNPYVLYRGFNTGLIPVYNYLKQVLGDDDKALQTIGKSPSVLTAPATLNKLQLNVEFFRNFGIADEIIKIFLMRNPRPFTRSPELIQDAAKIVDTELGIPRDSPMLLFGILTLASISKPTLQRKYEIFKSFGCTDSDVKTLVRKHPFCLTSSDDKLRRGLDFFIKELGYTPEYLVSHPALLTYSLEKRVKPRYELWKIMKENQLGKGKSGSFYSFVKFSESEFLSSCVLPYKDKLLNLHEIYKNCKSEKIDISALDLAYQVMKCHDLE